MATATGSVVQGHGARFAVACDVLSRYVKAAAAAPPAMVVAEQQQRPVAVAVLPLMPGADLSLSAAAQEEEQPGPSPSPAPAPSSQQLTISYGGQVVVVLDDVPADKAAELLRAAAAAAQQGAPPRLLRAKEDDDLPMARKASLQRFMEKRKGRAAARGSSPYGRPEAAAVSSSSFRDHLALTL